MMHNPRRTLQIVLLVLIIIGLVAIATQKTWVPKLVAEIISHDKNQPFIIPPPPKEFDESLADGKYCFYRSQEATPTAPYKVEESIIFGVKGNIVTGVKVGRQSGPDMTNGYTGTLTGTRDANSLELTYTYTIEGSKNTELEEYTFSNGTLTKTRWPLVEKNKILVPDKTGTPTLIPYSEEKCGS